jgi:hypothetical protein
MTERQSLPVANHPAGNYKRSARMHIYIYSLSKSIDIEHTVLDEWMLDDKALGRVTEMARCEVDEWSCRLSEDERRDMGVLDKLAITTDPIRKLYKAKARSRLHLCRVVR